MNANNNDVIFRVTVEKNNEYFRRASEGLTAIQKNRFLIYILALVIMIESVLITINTGLIPGVILLCLGIFLFIFTSLMQERNAAILKKRIPSWQTASPTDFFFRKNGFSETSAFTKSECSYKMIQAVKETKKGYFLFIGYAQALVIPKSCIDEERQDEFREFICSVTGNECKQIKNRPVALRLIISVIVSLIAAGSLAGTYFVTTLANMKPGMVTAQFDNVTFSADTDSKYDNTYETSSFVQFTDGNYTIEVSQCNEAEIKDMYKLKEAPDPAELAKTDAGKYKDTSENGILESGLDYTEIDEDGYYCMSVYTKVNKMYYITDIYIYSDLTDEEKAVVHTMAESVNFTVSE